ncbi:hypothetical protein OQZ33_05490 [Pedobacter sp. MC2016-05]|uniref:hypothetical protein n=1 Tax=Pedobacter sp. MC2016-05 TaxID=2994474 RepID=UPI002246D6E5|nr:hypothetical protein [Pedobacter sp. MC2016-05]MCX2473776.1 hypothetical protein [Pedobacter sp. MC2016-05]
MSLKGINRGTVVSMIDLLDQIQQLEQIAGINLGDNREISKLRAEIHEAYQEYDGLMKSIAMQVNVFQEIYSQVRCKVIPQKLRELRKMIPPEDVAYILLKDSILKSHGV